MATDEDQPGWIEKHSLAIFLLGLAAGFSALSSAAATHDWVIWSVKMDDFFDNRSAEAWGAFLITTASKWFREEGSPESKDPEEK